MSLLTLLADIKVVFTTDGSVPRPETATELVNESTPEGSRGSLVWYTQGSMMQTVDLPLGSVKATREMEKKMQAKCKRAEPYFCAKYDAVQALADGLFPMTNSHAT